MGTCLIPNCRKEAPSSEPFCFEHRDIEDRDPTYQKRYEAALRNWDVEVNDLRSKLEACLKRLGVEQPPDGMQSDEIDRLQMALQLAELRVSDYAKQYNAAQDDSSRAIQDLQSRLEEALKDKAFYEELNSKGDSILIELTAKHDALASRLGEVRSDLWGMFAHYAPTVLSKHPNDGWLIAFCQAIEAYIPTIDRAVENPVTIATDRTNERQTCNHCGNPVPCACW